MKASERRLLVIFVSLACVLGVVLVFQLLRSWQHRIERRERQAELAQMESTTLLAEAPQWLAKEAWLKQAQPVVASEADANTTLSDSLNNSAKLAGLEVVTVQVEQTEPQEFYRPFGVSLTLKGDYNIMMRWMQERLSDAPFYVMPFLHITPDVEKPEQIVAKMRIFRWYAPELASATPQGESDNATP